MKSQRERVGKVITRIIVAVEGSTKNPKAVVQIYYIKGVGVNGQRSLR